MVETDEGMDNESSKIIADKIYEHPGIVADWIEQILSMENQSPQEALALIPVIIDGDISLVKFGINQRDSGEQIFLKNVIKILRDFEVNEITHQEIVRRQFFFNYLIKSN